jgi:dipeptidyl-peptidase-4
MTLGLEVALVVISIAITIVASTDGFVLAAAPSRRPFLTTIMSSSTNNANANANTNNSNKKPTLTQADYRAKLSPSSKIQSQDVATLPRPGTTSPSSIQFHTTIMDPKDDSDHASTAAASAASCWITYLSPAPDQANSLTRKLWTQNIITGETKELLQALRREEDDSGSNKEDEFSLEEKLRRERARDMTTGVTSYETCDTSTIMVPLGGALLLLDLNADGSSQNITSPRTLVECNTHHQNDLPPKAPLLDAKLSQDGSTVAFVCDKEVYVMSTTITDEKENQYPIQITSGARGVDGMTNGVADYVAQEELERSDGFWLSTPHATRLAFEQVDESHIPWYRITHQGQDKGLSSLTSVSSPSKTTTSANVQHESTVTHEEHRYPFAGARNPKVKLGVVSTSRTTTTSATESDDPVLWFDLEQVFGDDFYLAKVEWLPNDNDTGDDDESTKMVVQLLDRRQQRLALLLLDAVTGTVTTLHVETAMEGAWINLNNSFRKISCCDETSTMQFLWASERDGYRHLYILEASTSTTTTSTTTEPITAKVVRRLTGPGEFIVDKVLDMDDTHVYYMGTQEGQWLQGHLFRVALKDSKDPTCLTGSIPGQHSCVVNLKAGLFVDTVSTVDHAPIVTIHKLPSPNEETTSSSESSLLRVIHNAATADDRVASLNLKPPTFHTFPSTDDKVTLQAAVYLPDEAIHGKGPWPLVVATYGGPHVQYVRNTWGMMTADMRSQFLRANGFAVLKVDNRGSNRRGLVFEAPIYGNLGELEVADQVAGVEWAIAQGIADKERVSVSGWSYGGYMALKCLTGRPDVFHAAVAGAPVTDWALYDTAYTERYMGLPQDNPEGYAKSSALSKVGDIEGSLLLCHGLLDENVLFRHSAVLVNALIQNQKAYDLALFPSERHGPRRPQDRAFLEERILAFLQRSLGL